jgi:hypothetical protein
MTTPSTTYAIRVAGHLDGHWAASLGEAALAHDRDGSTTLTLSVADQTRLHGALTALRDIGAVLLDLRVVALSPGAETRNRPDAPGVPDQTPGPCAR